MKLLFVISHKPDIRYQKRFDILKELMDITVIYWNKDSKDMNFQYSDIKFFEIKVPANKTNPLKRIPETLKFMKKAYQVVCRENPDCLYVGNLDMLDVAAKYRKHKSGVKIIYEIADLHRLIIDKQKNPIKAILSIGLKIKEKSLMGIVDLLVLTSMKFYDVYYKPLINLSKVVYMPNMPDEDSFVGFKKNQHEKFTVAFVGSIRYKNQLRMLIDAAQEANINVLFAGGDGEGPEFEIECEKYSNVEFRGEFNYKKEIQDIYSNVDCIYAVYDADMANVRVALPNKLYEAIMTEIPIIVAKDTHLSELVEKMGIGYSVSHKDKTDLVQVLNMIKNKGDNYQSKIANCRIEKSVQTLKTYNNQLLNRIRGL